MYRIPTDITAQNGLAKQKVLNNSTLYAIHASPLVPSSGNDRSLENYIYQRKVPPIGTDTAQTALKKKFYGNSGNRTASHIAEKRRINNVGIHSSITPFSNTNNAQSVYVANRARTRTRSSGYVVPEKCQYSKSNTHITPLFDGISISKNLCNPGGHKYYNMKYRIWQKFCKYDIATGQKVASNYWNDFNNGNAGTSAFVNTNNLLCNVPAGILQSTGYANTYTNIYNNYVHQPFIAF